MCLFMMSIFLFFFLFLLLMFFFNFFSFLNSLLILESLSLLIFFCLFFYSLSYFSLKFPLYFFVFIVCESCIGLSILVKIIKNFGFSMFRSMNLLSF